MWRAKLLRLLSPPLPVTLNLLAAAFLVFSLGTFNLPFPSGPMFGHARFLRTPLYFSLRTQNYNVLITFQFRLPLDLGVLVQIGNQSLQHAAADVGMGVFTPSEN